MKKLTAVLLASAMVMSLAACGKNNVTPTCDGGTETMKEEVVTTESDVTTETPETTDKASANGRIEDYVKDARDTYKHLERDGNKYHAPEVLIDSGCAKDINQEIARRFESYEAAITTDGYSHYTSSDYIVYLTKEGILTIVFVERGEWDDDIYHLYNIDVNTGDYVDNARLAEIAGITDIGKAAKDAVQAYFNATGNVKIENYKVVKDNNEPLNAMEKEIEDSFLDERLNDKMLVGLTSEGKMFFISALGAFGGAEWYNRMYDVNGVSLDTFENSDWVRG